MEEIWWNIWDYYNVDWNERLDEESIGEPVLCLPMLLIPNIFK
jgi:hypothetical protein